MKPHRAASTTQHEEELWKLEWITNNPKVAKVLSLVCKLRGHRWVHVDETTFLSHEPQVRACCNRCGFDGGLI